MKSRILKKVLLIFLVFNIFIFGVSNVYAEVNQKYGTLNKGDVDQTDPTDSSETGTLVGVISIAFLQIGKLIESLVSWLMNLLSSGMINEFPWADKIIFNTVAVLDVNFINPAQGSLFTLGNGQIGNIIKNIYFTGLSVAIGFLSIVVGVMAIRMAISTIAADKARYKESIVTFLTALVLLFGTHFLLSFTFYLNEKLVEVASDIVKDAVKNEEQNGIVIGNNGATSNESETVVSNLGQFFYETALDQGGSDSFLWINIDKAAPIPTVLYLMFIVQSLMFLFAYFKRFYYVVILSILAPFVVIYDFFTKAVS